MNFITEKKLLNNSGDPDEAGKTTADGWEGRAAAVLSGLRSEDTALMFATVNEPFGGTQPLQNPKQTMINTLIGALHLQGQGKR